MTRFPATGIAAALVLMALAVGLASCRKTEEDTSQAATEGATASAAPSSTTPVTAPSQSACHSNPSPAPGTELWRWGDLTVLIPEGSGVLVSGSIGKDGVPIMQLAPEADPDHGPFIDARNGTVTTIASDDDPVADEETAIEAILATVAICPLDPDIAPWPYSGEALDRPEVAFRNLRYLEPDPATGVQVFSTTACGVGGEGSGCHDLLAVESARSRMFIDAEKGAMVEPANIALEEQEAFDRYLASVMVTTQ